MKKSEVKNKDEIIMHDESNFKASEIIARFSDGKTHAFPMVASKVKHKKLKVPNINQVKKAPKRRHNLCYKCGHVWYSPISEERPLYCSFCNRPYWWQEKEG